MSKSVTTEDKTRVNLVLSGLGEQELQTAMTVLQLVCVRSRFHRAQLQTSLAQFVGNQRPHSNIFRDFLNNILCERQILPSFLFVTGVRCLETHPIAGGGFADVWKGGLGDKIVALKVLRLFGENTSIIFKVMSRVHQRGSSI